MRLYRQYRVSCYTQGMKQIGLALFAIASACGGSSTKANRVPAIAERGVAVLLYHHVLPAAEKAVSPYAGNDNVVTVEHFEEQMALLEQHGYRPMDSGDFLDVATGGHAPLPGSVFITFDDGLKSTYVNAYPILKRRGFNGGLFVITNRITNSPQPYDPRGLQFLSWEEIATMADVFSVGGHTHGLHYLTTAGVSALLASTEDEGMHDLETNRSLLGLPRMFAYPFGQTDDWAARLVETAGYTVAFEVAERRYSTGEDRFHIPRFAIADAMNMEQFATIVAGTR
jgi:peptidoglycan/xylan/chitin deacetylase (PgdA/CDA1 family)